MKKLLLPLLLLTAAGALPAQAQRHVKRLASWGVHAGQSATGRYNELTYSVMLTDRLALRLGGLRGAGPLAGGDYAAYQGRLLLAPQLFQLGEVVYVHLLLGAGAGLERVRAASGQPEPTGETSERWTYGPQAGAEMDVFLGNRLSLVATGTKGYWFSHSLVDQWPGYAGVGLRYHFR